MYQLAKGIQLYNSPEDDTQGEYIKLVSSAEKSVHVADYSFNIPQVVDGLIKLAESGVEVLLVLDNSQSKGKTEVPEITRLKACTQVRMVIVESDKSAIMHNKFTVIDRNITETGSWNYTVAASKENNNYFVFTDSETEGDNIASAFEKVFSDMFTGVTTKIKYQQ